MGRLCVPSCFPRPFDSLDISCPWVDHHPVAVADGGVLEEAGANVDSLGRDPFGLRSWFRDLNFDGSVWAGAQDRGWGAVTGAVGRALGWVAVKSHLIAMSHLNSPEHRLLHLDVLGPPGSSLGIQS